MTAMDSLGFVLGTWVACTGVVLGLEKARQELVARRAPVQRPTVEPGTVAKAFVPAQRTGSER